MFFENYLIFIYIICFVVIYNIATLITKNAVFRNIIILAGNIAILLTLVKEHTIIVLSVLSLLVFLIGKLLQKKNSKTVLSVTLSFILILFTIRNYPYIQNQISEGFFSFLKAPILSVQKIGLSYILFRYVHFLVESYKTTIQKSNFVTFINYILFFPSILAGPIDTYNNFQFWIENTKKKYQRALFFAGISRVFFGAFKTLAIVPLVINYATDYTVFIPDYSPLAAISISLFAYSAYIYFDFSGYSDIAIGTAYLVGIKTPENFNNPYISKSLSEFWKRWHITFSLFLKLYVFKPFIHLYNYLFNPKYSLIVTISAYITTFVICGLWHGDQINFVYWGLWHGVGLSINKLWTVYVKPKINWSQTYLYQVFSIVITFIFVTFGWVFFHYSHEELAKIYYLFV